MKKSSKINKKSKGFTMVELLLVFAISAILATTLGAGIVNLQATVKLDNSIRDLKTEIQATQNQARNSFLTYDRSRPETATNSFFAVGNTANNISLGWMITFQNQTLNSIQVVRRSVFFKPPASYDFDRLRDEVANFRTRLQSNLQMNKKFECDQNGVFKIGNVAQNGNNYSSIITGVSFSINCANRATYSGSEYFESSVVTVKFAKQFGPNALPSCWEEGLAGVQQSIFFTSGYGEPAVNYDATQGVLKDCQIQLQYTGFANANVRALKVSKDTGLVELCGVYCIN